MVKAIAPNAPRGANRITTLIAAKSRLLPASISSRIGRPLTQARQRVPDYGRDQHDREDVALGEGIDDGVRDDVQKELNDALLVRFAGILPDRGGIELGGVGVEARPRRQPVADEHADNEGERRDDLDVDQCLAADSPEL